MGLFDTMAKAFVDAADADNGGLADGTELYMDQKHSIKDSYDIVDAEKNLVYQVKGNLTGLTFKMNAANGGEVAEIKKKLVAMSPSYEMSFGSGKKVSLKKKMALIKEEFNGTINGKTLQIKGDIAADKFEVHVDGQKIGAVAKKVLSLHDAYVISSVDDSWKEVMVALVVAIDNACHNNSDD